MRVLWIIATTLLLLGTTASTARADIGPPDNECTASWKSSSSRICTECQPEDCADTVPEDYEWVCDSEFDPYHEVWCGPRPDDGGCGASVGGGQASGSTTLFVLLALFAIIGIALYRRSRSDARY